MSMQCEGRGRQGECCDRPAGHGDLPCAYWDGHEFRAFRREEAPAPAFRVEVGPQGHTLVHNLSSVLASSRVVAPSVFR